LTNRFKIPSVAFRHLRGFPVVKAKTFRSCGLNLFYTRVTVAVMGAKSSFLWQHFDLFYQLLENRSL
jgi:hypothetical protein